jgi:hypothetical protein
VSERVELSLQWAGAVARWWTAGAGLFAVAAGGAAGWGVAPAGDWAILAVLAGGLAVAGGVGLLRRRLEAGPDGVRFRMVVRWRRLGWDEIVRFEDLRMTSDKSRMRAGVVLRDGSRVLLPVPLTSAVDAHVFEKELSQLRALLSRHRRSTQGV